MKHAFPRLALALGLFVLGACSTDRPDERSKPAPPSILKTTPKAPTGAPAQGLQLPEYRTVKDASGTENVFVEGRTVYNQGKKSEGIAKVASYLKDNPTGQFADEAGMFLGRAALSLSDFQKAYNYFWGVVQLSPPSRLRSEAVYESAKAKVSHNDRKSALAALARIDPRELTPALRLQVFYFWGQVASEEGRYLESMLAYIKAYREQTDPRELESLERTVESQVQEKMPEAELKLVLREYPNQFPSGPILLKLVTLKLASGDRAEAQNLLSQVMTTQAPGSRYHKKAEEILGRLGSLNESPVEAVGALLPLAGEFASISRSFADGLELGLRGGVPGKGGLELVTADSGPSVESAIAAFERLVFENRVMAVVGPFSGPQAERVATRASELGIPYIALSPRAGLLEKGPSVFRAALTPEKQVRALVSYAWDRLNPRNFAILFPQDAFGREYATEYFKAVEEKGGFITAADSYDPGQTDFRIPIENMVGTSFPSFRRTEMQAFIKQQEERLGRVLLKRELDKLSLPPIVDFDVLFVPDTFKAVGQIAPALAAADVDKVQLMGPSGWHNQRLLSRAGNYLEKGLLVDIFSAEKQNSKAKTFSQELQKTKGSQVTALSALGHDIGLALRMATGGRNLSGRDELRARLENLGSVEGVSGLQIWDAKRDVVSEVQLFQINHGNFRHMGGILIK